MNRITLIRELSAIDKAQDIAMLTHAGQKRKASGQPYFIHPYRVYQRAKAAGLSKDIQIIAILHDVYEDSNNKDYIRKEIERQFGKVILNFILLLSHDKSVDYEQYVLRLAKLSKVALTVKLLDMLENLKDNPSEKQKTKYLGSIEYLLKNNISIDPKILNMFNEFK